jgi:hypothetical protein
MNKYEYLWIIQGFYSRWEDLSAYDIYKEARSDLKAYRDNEKGIFRIINRRVLRGK